MKLYKLKYSIFKRFKEGQNLFIFTIILCLFNSGLAQIPNNTWRDHLPYSRLKKVIEVENKILCLTTGGLFSYNRQDYSFQKYSKATGLSDVDISSICYSKDLKTLLIGYNNGNIDIIRNDSIFNIPDIKSKLLSAEKTINDILFINNEAFLCTGFGIVVINLSKLEIKDSYMFDENGGQIYVNDLAFDNNFLYAATEEGIFKADISSPNLVDYNYWQKLNFIPSSNSSYSEIEYFDNTIIAKYFDVLGSQDDIILIHTSSSEIWSFDENMTYYSITESNNQLVVVAAEHINIYSDLSTLSQTNDLKYYYRNAIVDEEGILWIATTDWGLGKYDNGTWSSMSPNGPQYKDVGRITSFEDILWVGAGNNSNQWAGRGGYSFINDRWESYYIGKTEGMEGFLNIAHFVIDPRDPNHVLGGSLGYGIIEFQNNEIIEIFDETDGILEPIEGYGHGYVIIAGMSYDRNNDLWISTSSTSNPIYVLRSNGNWENLELEYNNFGVFTTIRDIFATSFGQIWLLINNTGIIVFTEDNGSITERFFKIKNSEGDVIEKVYSITEDRDGYVWIGTDKGPVRYSNPEYIFEETEVIGEQILIPRNDGTTIADILLQTETINDIVIDGANRKWFATERSGVYLMSEDAKTEIHNFNTENSPLLSNNVVCMEINHQSGEVFFGTENGIVSFMGQATLGSDDFENVYVYPNPVRPEYSGDITITGLIADVNVKITDISGNIVYETISLGGQAIWDGKNFSGKSVSSGVYLIFCANEDGSKTHVTKLLIVR